MNGFFNGEMSMLRMNMESDRHMNFDTFIGRGISVCFPVLHYKFLK